jgi:hypothetical protein
MARMIDKPMHDAFGTSFEDQDEEEEGREEDRVLALIKHQFHAPTYRVNI